MPLSLCLCVYLSLCYVTCPSLSLLYSPPFPPPTHASSTPLFSCQGQGSLTSHFHSPSVASTLYRYVGVFFFEVNQTASPAKQILCLSGGGLEKDASASSLFLSIPPSLLPSFPPSFLLFLSSSVLFLFPTCSIPPSLSPFLPPSVLFLFLFLRFLFPPLHLVFVSPPFPSLPPHCLDTPSSPLQVEGCSY